MNLHMRINTELLHWTKQSLQIKCHHLQNTKIVDSVDSSQLRLQMQTILTKHTYKNSSPLHFINKQQIQSHACTTRVHPKQVYK